jgi:CHAP domain
MFEFVDLLLQKRRFVIAGMALAANLLLMSLLAQTLQAHHASITARIHNSYATQVPQTYDSPNVVTNALFQAAGNAGQAVSIAEVKALSTAMSAAASVTSADKAVMQGAKDTGRAAGAAAMFTLRGAVAAAAYTGRIIRGGFGFAFHMICDSFGFMLRSIGAGFGLAGHTTSRVFGFFYGFTHVSSVIRVSDHTPTPTITQLRIQQAALIQSGTKSVPVATLASGAGGACDAGDGNGGYPGQWCNAAMDSVATIPYSSDPINRECTSYAYWYFTSVEGDTSFKVWGNAKDWAATSNYPTYATPVVGAIAVETAGAYGHVAIVQALPGQKYAGEVVPAGYVLVSEMNYDWDGHFRYSYSPLSKFSAYIYP